MQPPRLLRPYERLWQESTLSTAQSQGFKGLFTSSFLALNQCCTKYYILYTCSFVLSCLFALLLLETVLPENSDIFLAELFRKIVWRIYIGRELNNLGKKFKNILTIWMVNLPIDFFIKRKIDCMHWLDFHIGKWKKIYNYHQSISKSIMRNYEIINFLSITHILYKKNSNLLKNFLHIWSGEKIIFFCVTKVTSCNAV